MKTIAHKIIESHTTAESVTKGSDVPLKIDQILAPDDDVVPSFLQFETLGLERVQTELMVCYIDHNTQQMGPESANDHQFLQSFSSKYGIHLSRPGNGICHQLHLERFTVPGQTVMGADSHTPTAGAVGMLGIGAGGLDMVAAMAGYPLYLKVPATILIQLTGRLPAWTSAKDTALEVMRLLGVRGGKGKILEFDGPGLKTFSIPERATIANMGTETGATSSVFPSDDITRTYLRNQGRASAWKEIKADPGAVYDDTLSIDLDRLEPLVAKPFSPGNIERVSAVEGRKVDQINIGGCANSSLRDLAAVAHILKGKKVPPEVSVSVTPGSRRIYIILSQTGILAQLLQSGIRILEPTCGPCLGLGQAPPSNSVSLRTFNRNFKGRCGTPDAEVFLVSPETAAASALTGTITDPRNMADTSPRFFVPKDIVGDLDSPDDMIVSPADHPAAVKVIKGPNIGSIDVPKTGDTSFHSRVLLKLDDDITTDDIIVAGTKGVPLRSNVPILSELVFEGIDPTFAQRAKQAPNGTIVAGDNYGQGSARDHAALCPKYLAIRTVIAKSFARIHLENLINYEILPLIFSHPEDYLKIDRDDELQFENVYNALENARTMKVKNLTKGITFSVDLGFTARQRRILTEGGLLNLMRREIRQKQSSGCESKG